VCKQMEEMAERMTAGCESNVEFSVSRVEFEAQKGRQAEGEFVIKSADYKPYPPSANFILTKILRNDTTSEDLFERAIRSGLMIRDCSTFPFLDQKFIRFCIMKPEDNERLLECLTNP